MKKYALITGASSGIGLELVFILAKDSYNLILVARNEKKLQELKTDILNKFQLDIQIIAKDLSIPNASKELVLKMQELKCIPEILINNAGFGEYGMYHETNWEKEFNMIQLNIIALSQLTKLLLPSMIQNHYGRILNVASLAAYIPIPYMAVYSSTKAYVLSFSNALQSELRGTGVSVTALCPGPVKTGFEQAASLEGAGLFKRLPVADAKSVALIGYKSMMRKRSIVVPGINKLSTFMIRFLPKMLVVDITGKYIMKN